MVKFKVSAILPLPADVYFVERDSAAFRSLVAETCKLESLEIGNSWLEGEAEVYEFVTKPNIEKYVPHTFKHLLPGGDLHYIDVIEYDPKKIAKSPYRMHVHSIPPIFANKANIDSWLTIEEVTPHTCRQILEGTIEINIFGLGALAERIVVDNLKTVYKGIPKIVERWSNFRSEVLKHPEGQEILVRGRPRNDGVEWISDRLRDVIKARDSDSDSPSVPSTPRGSDSNSPLQTTEDFLSQHPAEEASPVDDEEEVEFFDARENVSWINLADLADGDLRLQSSLRRDMQDAQDILTSYRKSGRRLRVVEVDAIPNRRSGGLERKQSRFSQDYNDKISDWRDFWQEHEVPEAKHAIHLRRRLANLFRIGAAVGMFKPGKHHKRKGSHHKRTDSRSSNGTESVSVGDSSDSPSLEGVQGADHSGSSKQSSSKGHSRSRSASFMKDLFTRSFKPSGEKSGKEKSEAHHEVTANG